MPDSDESTSVAPSSAEIAAALREISGYLELDRERFRARAYENAAGTVEAVARPRAPDRRAER